MAKVLAAALTLTALLSGCGKLLGPKDAVVRNYPDGAAGLQQMWNDVLSAAQADDREQVHAIFQSLKMTRPELDRLFGPRARDLAPAYDDMISSFIFKGAVDIVAVIYEKKYDRAEILPMLVPDATVGATAEATPGVRADEIALARALVTRPTLYSVRLKKGDDPLGNRYDFFFYSDGHWRTGNQLGKLIAKREGIESAVIRDPKAAAPVHQTPTAPPAH